MHNFIPVVFAQKFNTSSLFGSTITCITLMNCTDNLFGDAGSIFLFWPRSFRNAQFHNVEKLPVAKTPMLDLYP